jgi:hypothetical protein
MPFLDAPYRILNFQSLTSNVECVWIGLTDLAMKQVFRWDDGDLLAWNNWEKFNPENGFEHCVKLCTSYQWETTHCDNINEYPALCAIPSRSEFTIQIA